MGRNTAIAYFCINITHPGQALASLEHEIGVLRAFLAENALRLIDAHVDRYARERLPRIELMHALQRCRATDALLVIPRLGRLAKDPQVFEAIENSKVRFVMLDRPDIRPETLVTEGVRAYREDPRAMKLGVEERPAADEIYRRRFV